MPPKSGEYIQQIRLHSIDVNGTTPVKVLKDIIIVNCPVDEASMAKETWFRVVHQINRD
jgi:hypothetical protein